MDHSLFRIVIEQKYSSILVNECVFVVRVKARLMSVFVVRVKARLMSVFVVRVKAPLMSVFVK